MELRLLTTEAERRIFANRMDDARAKRGVAHFRETRRSNIGKVHLDYGQLYALFEHDNDPAENMMSGFIMHDIGTFPQSYPKPDLTHLPARSVLECGELWSYAKGAGILARRGATILAGLMQIKAILVYPLVDPWDNTVSYTQTNFVKVGERINWPYCEMLDGRPVVVQAMVLEGDALGKLIHKVFSLGFETADSHRRIRFDNPFSIEPSLSQTVEQREPEKTNLSIEAHQIANAGNGHSHEMNGDAQA
jgi:hypothetical protein